MRILVANIPLPTNRFLVDLNAALGNHHQVVHDAEIFWNREGAFDVVHLHFPEYLTYALQEAYLTGLTDTLIADTEERLRWWAERAHIVITRHVLLPHDALSDPMWERLYKAVYHYADGVAHFAQASIDEFRERYAGMAFYRGHAPVHAIIPHQNYASLPNTVSRAEARRALRIAPNARVMLVFGAIRNDAERQLILETFRGIRVKHKHLLVSRWREQLADVSWIRLKYWIRDLTRLWYRLHPRFTFNYGFVAESDAQRYLNAADVLFIPRLRVLNSGNITLGMTFGRVVVGPDSWDVGELLRETGNPVFDPDHPETAAAAMEEGFRLAAGGEISAANRERALSQWTVEQCARLYTDLYRTCEKFS
ncbi:MAG: hypothetical protein IT487_11170 [Chromatiaceae bacterium]|nr:hypothetical protein [Chromatiaceae bacterium]